MNYIIKKIIKKNIFLAKRDLEKKMMKVGYIYDDITANYLLGDVHEEKIQELLRKYIFKKIKLGVSIDIGAHIGSYSIFLSKYFKKVYSFECNPTTFRILMLNSELIKNIKTFNLFLSNSNKKIYLEINELDSGHCYQSKKHSNISIKSVNTEKFLNHKIKKKIDFIKIDVEGYEADILLSIKNLLIKNKPIILFESLDSEYYKGSKSSFEVLRKIGYNYFYIPNTPIKISKKNLIYKIYGKIMLITTYLRFLIQGLKIVEIKKIEENINYPGIIASFEKLKK